MDKTCADLVAKAPSEHSEEWKSTCDTIKAEHTAGPEIMGKILWKHMQRKHCECVKDSRLLSNHEQTLKNFYEQYAPGSASKVP